MLKKTLKALKPFKNIKVLKTFTLFLKLISSRISYFLLQGKTRTWCVVLFKNSL